MYRYSVDNAITYTSEDFVLFRESPFACWMERLTLENPDHGIPADAGSSPPRSSIERQDDLADTLRCEGKDVVHVSWDMDEATRRAATLEAMRSGADYIVDGQLALGPLASPVNLLVRTSGYSELGDYLYTPCDTQARTSLHSAFRLCFLADLLHSLQGQLPPQMLLIRDGEDLVPLATDDHIYHYRAVKQRFMEAMRNFRKHRMPDPAESSHFGRWSDCAHEVLKQRLQRQEREADRHDSPAEEAVDRELLVQPLPQAVAAATEPGGRVRAVESTGAVAESTAGFTLAEQAQRLAPGTYKPGPGFFRLRQIQSAGPVPAASRGNPPASRAPEPASPSVERPQHNRRASDKALQNLEFIGSSKQAPAAEAAPPPVDDSLTPAARRAPPPNLRSPRSGILATAPAPTLNPAAASAPVPGPGPADPDRSAPDEPEEVKRAPQDSEPRSFVDRDSGQDVPPPPVFTTADARYEEDEDQREVPSHTPVSRPFSDSIFNDPLFTDPLFVDSDTPLTGSRQPGYREAGPDRSPISDTLITSDDFEE